MFYLYSQTLLTHPYCCTSKNHNIGHCVQSYLSKRGK